jgi:hypothetical protein
MALNIEAKFQKIFGAGSAPVLDEVALDEINQAQDIRSDLFQIESMDREITQWTKLSTLGVMDQVTEGELASKDSFTQLGLKTYTAIKYAKAIGITDEMMDDQRFDLINRMVRSLGRSAFETQMVAAMNLFNNSFATETAYDGVALISASHTSQTGNQSNIIAAAADISYAGLKEGENYFRKLKDDRGKRLMSMPSVVLVSEDFRHDALELVNTPFKPGSANNDINSLSNLKVVSSNFLSDADAWFMTAPTSDQAHGLKIYNRKPLETRTHEDVLGGVLYYKAEYRQAIGADEWRGIWGSQGA